MLTALAVFAVALLATPFLTNRETKPIQDMAAAARQIAHGNLNVRVSTNCQTEEMEELAVAFNNMAAAMQNADTARQEFVANVSHELKTPMTTIAGYLDGMLDGTIRQPGAAALCGAGLHGGAAAVAARAQHAGDFPPEGSGYPG